MCAHYKCPRCGLIFSYSLIPSFIAKNYEMMIKMGTLAPEAKEKIEAQKLRSRLKILIHPSYVRPMCPRCGTPSIWIGSWAKEKLEEKLGV